MIKIHLCVIDRYVCGIIVQFILATGVSASGDAEHRISVVSVTISHSVRSLKLHAMAERHGVKPTRLNCSDRVKVVPSVLESNVGVPELIPVLEVGSQPAGARSLKPGGRLSLLSGGPRLPPQPPSITAHWLVPIYSLVDRGTCVYNLPSVALTSDRVPKPNSKRHSPGDHRQNQYPWSQDAWLPIF